MVSKYSKGFLIMCYCDICSCYNDEHTDGEPDMQRGKYYKPTREYKYSLKAMGKDYCNYDWGHIFPDVFCMCESCFKSYDRLGKIKWN